MLTCIIQNYLYYCGFCTPSFSQIPQHNAGRAEMLPIQVIQEIMVNNKKELIDTNVIHNSDNTTKLQIM